MFTRLGMVVYASNSSAQKLMQEHCEFEASLGYRVCSRIACATYLLSQNKQTNK